MASLSNRAPFICRNCIQRLRSPPSGLHTTLPLSQTRSLRISIRNKRRDVAEGTTTTTSRSTVGGRTPIRTIAPREKAIPINRINHAYEAPLPTPGPPPINRINRYEAPLPTPGPPPINRLDPFEAKFPTPGPPPINRYLAAKETTLVEKRIPFRKVGYKSALSAPKAVAKPTSYNWYWETLAPSTSQRSQANAWFGKKSTPQFLTSVAKFRVFPESDVPEVAFVGRSNVGKSSLLNAVVKADIKDLLARTSKTPGCTKTMNLYGVGPHDGVRVRPGKNNGHDRIVGIGGVMIVDLPGYGEGSFSEWGTEIMKYLTQRKQLRRVFVLVDALSGLKDKDRSILASLRLAGVPHQILLSKLDKVYIPPSKAITRFDGKGSKSLVPKGNLEELRLMMADIRTEIQPRVGGGALGELLGVSAEVLVDGKQLGVDAVRVAVLQAAGVSYEAKRKNEKAKLVRDVEVDFDLDIKRPMTDMLMDAHGQPAKNYRGKVVKPY